jgi:hypothetical protein
MKLPFLSVLCAAALFCMVGMAVADPDKNESGKGRERHQYSSEKDRTDKKYRQEGWHGQDAEYGSYFHEHGYTHLDIPPGHYPPPGECRLWYPDSPPGHQPPPGRCSPVPHGAWVIYHPHDNPGYVHVIVYEPQRPGIVRVVGEFEIASGVFVRVILEK